MAAAQLHVCKGWGFKVQGFEPQNLNPEASARPQQTAAPPCLSARRPWLCCKGGVHNVFAGAVFAVGKGTASPAG